MTVGVMNARSRNTEDEQAWKVWCSPSLSSNASLGAAENIVSKFVPARLCPQGFLEAQMEPTCSVNYRIGSLFPGGTPACSGHEDGHLTRPAVDSTLRIPCNWATKPEGATVVAS
jgi:hypothetical protein